MKVKKFKQLWQTRLKWQMDKAAFELFYNIVDIDNNVGRTMELQKTGVFTNGRNYNPKFMMHWFPVCRCHWNVILPCFVLNGNSFIGKYSIITSDKHSAIINTATKEIYDPTYATQNNEQDTLKMLGENYKIEELGLFILHADTSVFERAIKNKYIEEKEYLFGILDKVKLEVERSMEKSNEKEM
jgi:hypothetical protein